MNKLNKILGALVFANLLIFAGPAFAINEAARTIKKGFDITVNSYDAATDTFVITINSELGVGPNYATPDELQKAIAYEGGKRDFTKQRSQMLGSVYALKKDLKLLDLTDLPSRRKKK